MTAVVGDVMVVVFRREDARRIWGTGGIMVGNVEKCSLHSKGEFLSTTDAKNISKKKK